MASTGLRAVAGGMAEAAPVEKKLLLDFGITRLFGTADIAERGLHGGWSPCEDGHNWNDGPDATLCVWTANAPTTACKLTIEGSPYLAAGYPRQTMTLYVNGLRIAYWSLAENRPYTLAATIEPEQWLQRDDGCQLNVVWHLPESVKPIDIGDAQDHRQLGFCFRSLAVEPMAD